MVQWKRSSAFVIGMGTTVFCIEDNQSCKVGLGLDVFVKSIAMRDVTQCTCILKMCSVMYTLCKYIWIFGVSP
jgi:hypothetical protein